MSVIHSKNIKNSGIRSMVMCQISKYSSVFSGFDQPFSNHYQIPTTKPTKKREAADNLH